MDVSKKLEKIFHYIDGKQSFFIDDLSKIVSIRSVISLNDPQTFYEIINWVIEYLEQLGVQVTLKEVGNSTLPNGDEIVVPPVILGTLGNDPKKKTVCAYCHMDVYSAEDEEGWNSKPFTLTERNGKLYGRGTNSNKGPLASWIHTVEAFQAVGEEIPVNLKFLFECSASFYCPGLKNALLEEKDFIKNVDYFCLTQYSWLNKYTPCLTYSLRGISYFLIDIECAKEDLHSGIHGGSVYEAMADLVYMLDSLVDKNGNILIKDVYENVAPVTEHELAMLKQIDFVAEDYRKFLGANKLKDGDDNVQVLINRWRQPSLSIHGIEYANSKRREIPVIPKRAVGKFSVRFTSNQTPDEIESLVKKYLYEKWEERQSSNSIEIFHYFSCRAWKTDPTHPHFSAAQNAIVRVYNKKADLVGEGGAMGAVTILEELSKGHIIVFPLVTGDFTGMSPNENIDVKNFINLGKVIAAYLYEVSSL